MTLYEWILSLFNIKPNPTPPTPQPEPVPTPEPAPPAPTIKAPAGHGMMHSGDPNNKNRYLTDAQVRNPKIKFYVPRDRWFVLNPSRNVYTFNTMLREIERYVKAGKNYIVPVMTGTGCNPSWLGNEPPWSLALLDAYQELHHRLEVATRSEYRVGVWVTGPTIASQEMHFSSKGVTMQSFPGYAPQKLISAWSHIIDTLETFYIDCPKILSLSFQTEAYDRFSTAYVPSVVNYACDRLGPSEVCFQWNALHPTFSRDYIGPLLRLGETYRIGGEKREAGLDVGFDSCPELDYIVNYPNDERFF